MCNRRVTASHFCDIACLLDSGLAALKVQVRIDQHHCNALDGKHVSQQLQMNGRQA